MRKTFYIAERQRDGKLHASMMAFRDCDNIAEAVRADASIICLRACSSKSEALRLSEAYNTYYRKEGVYGDLLSGRD